MDNINRYGAHSPISQQGTNEEQNPIINHLVMKINILEMNMGLLSSQINNSIQNLNNRLEELEKNKGKSEVISETQKNNVHVIGSSTQQGSSTLTQQEIGSSTQTTPSPISKKNPVQETQVSPKNPKAITPLAEIIKANPGKGKEVQIVETPPLVRTSTSNVFDLEQQYDYYKLVVKKLNLLSLSHKTIKYVSHFAFNKAIIYPGTPPNIVKILYNHGLIQSIYPSTQMTEISELPLFLREAVSSYFGIVTQHQVFIRCYSTIAEITPDKFYHPVNLIRLGTTKKPIEYKHDLKEEIEDDEEFQNRCSSIRAQDFAIIFQEMNRIITSPDEIPWVYHTSSLTCVYSLGKTNKNDRIFYKWYERVKDNKFENTSDTRQKICQILNEYPNHECNYCKEQDLAEKETVITCDPNLL